MSVYLNMILLLIFSIFHGIVGSDIVSGICTISIIFLFAIDEIKESIISAIKEQENK